jgi:hypothetical protein
MDTIANRNRPGLFCLFVSGMLPAKPAVFPEL